MAYYILKSYKLKVDPFKIFSVLSRQRNCFFLDSSLNSGYNLGRYSFLGIEPFEVLNCSGAGSFARLRRALDKYRICLPRSNLPFLGGAVGYLAYDLGFALEEKLSPRPKPRSGIPDCFFGLYNTGIIIDHLKGLLYICATGFPETSPNLARSLCKTNFKKIQRLILQAPAEEDVHLKAGPGVGCRELESSFSKKDYLKAVRKALDYIRQGDIYQVNLSQEFRAKTDLPAREIYRRLRSISPSCFSAYFDAGDFQILSSSPERFLSLTGDKAVTRPMKGTRPRGRDKREDVFLRRQLLASPKDKAELTMVVDLERNDLGRVCSYNSIKVAQLRELERYNTVYQATSTIEGRLHRDKDRFQLLRACFPGGSITGCPKIRAMEIIEEIEPQRRSIYTGCLGYLSFSGGMDFNILIRTILKKDNRLSFGVGGGIVADSRPEQEYEETLVKARAMFEAISGDFNK